MTTVDAKPTVGLDRLNDIGQSLFADPAVGFYGSAPWLRATETLDGASAGYLRATSGPETVAAVAVHLPDTEENRAYRPHEVFPYREPAPYLLLGPRRGYRAGLALDPDHAAAAAGAILRAAADLAAARGRDWVYALYLTDASARAVAASGMAVPVLAPLFDTWIPVRGDSMSEHLRNLTKSQRRRVRQDRERVAAAGLCIQRERLADCLEEVLPLRGVTFAAHGATRSAASLRVEFELLVEHAADHEVFHTVRDRPGARLRGYALSYDWGGMMWGRSLALEQSLRVPATPVMFELLAYLDLDACFERGLRGIHLGPVGYPAKLLRGAEITPLWQVSLYRGREVFPIEGVSRWTDHVLGRLASESAGLLAPKVIAEFRAKAHEQVRTFTTAQEDD